MTRQQTSKEEVKALFDGVDDNQMKKMQQLSEHLDALKIPQRTDLDQDDGLEFYQGKYEDLKNRTLNFSQASKK